MMRVLIVDYEPQILCAASTCRPATTTSSPPRTAPRHCDHPDLVVLDLGLPDMDGVEVIQKLRTWTPVPIIILSGRLDSRGKIAALDAGADDYVTKPFNIGELLARIRAVTRRTTSTLTLTRPVPAPPAAEAVMEAAEEPVEQVADRLGVLSPAARRRS